MDETEIKYTVGKGWHPLVDEAKARLEKLGVKIISHYEKYGTLRFEIEPEPIEATIILNELEDRSVTICEMCGAAGQEVEFKGWTKTLCPVCIEEWEDQHSTAEYLKAKEIKTGMRVKLGQLQYIYDVYILLSNTEANTDYDEIAGTVEFVGKELNPEISAKSIKNGWLCYIRAFDERESFDLDELNMLSECSKL